jgi:ubiquinone/menaquinone biosynthesis C-methylase UbiE
MGNSAIKAHISASPAEGSDPVESDVQRGRLSIEHETRRIREVYERRQALSVKSGETSLDAYERCAIHEREELLAHIFQKIGWSSLAGLRILEIGCGTGTLIRHLYDFGAEPEKCYGVDVLDSRLHEAKHLGPNANFLLASAADLPLPNERFDLVLQFTVFTSVLAADLKQAMAAEILRVLRKGGRFVWYDFAYDNRRNRNVRGIGRGEIRRLLPNCRLRFWRVTVAPPVGRPAARISPFLYRIISELGVFRSHYMCLAEKL